MRWIVAFLLFGTPAFADTLPPWVPADIGYFGGSPEEGALWHGEARLRRHLDYDCKAPASAACVADKTRDAAIWDQVRALHARPRGPLPADTPPDLAYVGTSFAERGLWSQRAELYQAWRRDCSDSLSAACHQDTDALNRNHDAILGLHKATP